MKKTIIILIALIFLLKRFSLIPTTIVYIAVPILLVYFLIRTAFRGATGKTKRGRTGSIYDDYL